MPFPSEVLPRSNSSSRRRQAAFLALLVAAVVMAGAAVAVAEIVNTGRFVVGEDEIEDEDVYVAATTGRVDGRIEGDLVIAAESVEIAGTVTGDVLLAVRDTVRVEGVVEGSLRGAVRRLELIGTVEEDVVVAAVAVDVRGEVGRDVIGLGASADIGGSVGRDVRGRFWSVNVAGGVARDVEVTVDAIAVSAPAEIRGDVVYQSVTEIDLADGAAVGGQIIQIPADAPFSVGLVLSVAGIVGFLGYLLGGIVLLWLFPATSARAVAAIMQRSGRTLLIGFAVLLVGPLLLVLLAASLVGIPLALIVIGLMALGVLFGSVPLVTAVGVRLLGGRGGSYGGFILVAVVGRLLAALWSPLGVAIYGVAVVWGIGGWLAAAHQVRRLAYQARSA